MELYIKEFITIYISKLMFGLSKKNIYSIGNGASIEQIEAVVKVVILKW